MFLPTCKNTYRAPVHMYTPVPSVKHVPDVLISNDTKLPLFCHGMMQKYFVLIKNLCAVFLV